MCGKSALDVLENFFGFFFHFLWAGRPLETCDDAFDAKWSNFIWSVRTASICNNNRKGNPNAIPFPSWNSKPTNDQEKLPPDLHLFSSRLQIDYVFKPCPVQTPLQLLMYRVDIHLSYNSINLVCLASTNYRHFMEKKAFRTRISSLWLFVVSYFDLSLFHLFRLQACKLTVYLSCHLLSLKY